jgi:adhesin/invasin
MRALPTIVAISLTALGLAACDKGIPTAPAGTTLVLTASPLTIPTSTGTSTVTVTAVRSGGQPVNPGTEIQLDTTLGSIEPIVTTDERGQAAATLRGNGVGGEATVTARSGTATKAEVKVTIGDPAETVTVTAAPASIPADEPASVSIVAVVRGKGGQPIRGASVVFTTSAGRLASQGTIVVTNASGEARDTLSASTDAVAAAGAKITVTASASSGGVTKSGAAEITIRGVTP